MEGGSRVWGCQKPVTIDKNPVTNTLFMGGGISRCIHWGSTESSGCMEGLPRIVHVVKIMEGLSKVVKVHGGFIEGRESPWRVYRGS